MDPLLQRNFCRLCGIIHIETVDIYNSLSNEDDLAARINTYLPVKVSPDDTLPLICCIDCSKTLNDFQRLFVCCIETENLLKDLQISSEDGIVNDVAKNPPEKIFNSKEGSDTSVCSSDSEENVDNFDLKTNISTNESQKLMCVICSKIFIRKSSLHVHLIAHKVILKRQSLLTGVLDHRLKSDLEKFGEQITISDVVSKVLSVHTMGSQFRNIHTCLVCKKVFSNRYENIIHQYKIHQTESYSYCKNKASISVSQKSPSVRISNNKWKNISTCKLCCLSFTDNAEMLEHTAKTHPSGKLTTLTCQTCMRQFSTPITFRHHNKVAHKPFEPRTKTRRPGQKQLLEKLKITDDCGVVRYKCDICDTVIKRPYQILAHYDRHGGNYRFCCEHCGQKFTNHVGLQNHLQRHSGVRSEECTVCHAKFYDKRILKNHMALHDEVAKYVCEMCGKSFKQIANYYVHKRLHSSDTFTHKCPFCTKKFRVSSRLKTHIWTHTGEKPYDCSLCSRTFRLRKTLKKHMRVHKGFENTPIPVKKGVYKNTKVQMVLSISSPSNDVRDETL